MEIFKASIKEAVLLDKGKWGIVMEFVLEEGKLVGKEVLIDYDEVDDLNETGDGCLMTENQSPRIRVTKGEVRTKEEKFINFQQIGRGLGKSSPIVYFSFQSVALPSTTSAL